MRKKEPSTTRSFRLPTSLINTMKEIAIKEDRSVTEVMRRLIEEVLKNKGE